MGERSRETSVAGTVSRPWHCNHCLMQNAAALRARSVLEQAYC